MSIHDRLDRLEKKYRRLRVLLGFTVVLVFAAVITGATYRAKVGEVVSAQAFVVKDRSGKIRGSFGYSEGKIILSLNDRQGPRVVMSAEGGGPSFINIYSRSGKRQVYMGVSSKSLPRFSLYGSDGVRRMIAGVTSKNYVNLQMTGPHRKIKVAIGVTNTGLPIISLYDQSGKSGWIATQRGARKITR